MSLSDHIDSLDQSFFDGIEEGGTSSEDLRSLLAVHAALAARGDFCYLEIGSYWGRSLQAFSADPRCRRIVSIDRRTEVSPDERAEPSRYRSNTTAVMLERLAEVQGADVRKLTTIDASTEDLDPEALQADLCFIDAEHTNDAALRDARFCRRVIRDRGVIMFHDRTLVGYGIRRFLAELSQYHAYPLAHDLLVVEINVASLLSDRRVKSQVPRRLWLVAERLRAMPAALWLGAIAGRARRR